MKCNSAFKAQGALKNPVTLADLSGNPDINAVVISKGGYESPFCFTNHLNIRRFYWYAETGNIIKTNRYPGACYPKKRK
jgi:hypothetical protein